MLSNAAKKHQTEVKQNFQKIIVIIIDPTNAIPKNFNIGILATKKEATVGIQ